MKKKLEEELLRQRGNGPTYLELVVVIYVLGNNYNNIENIIF